MLAEATYVFHDEESQFSIVIDPGAYTARERFALDDYLDSLNAPNVIILLTHSHLDHIFGVAHLVQKYGAKVYLHQLEEQYLFMNTHLCESWHIPEPDAFSVDRYLKGGDVINFGNLSISVLDVPGHSAGGLAFYLPDENVVFTGDVLFAGSMGRYDFPGGNEQQLWNSLRTQLMSLPGSTRVFPGHGPSTTIDNERFWIDEHFI